MARAEKKKQRKRRGDILPKLVILLFLVMLAWRLHGLRAQVAMAEAERDRRSAEVEELREQNAELAVDLAEGATPEKVEELARQELGMVRKDEYVFYAGN